MKIEAGARSDQFNADDFIGGPRTFTVAGTSDGKADAKYDIEFVEGEGKAWRPPLSMLRAVMHFWGDESDVWIGRRVTLYRDASVRFGKDVPGGVRISHLSDIGDKPATVSLTVSKGKRQLFTFQPLPSAPKPVVKDWRGLADMAGGDKETLRSLYTDAQTNGADPETLEYIKGSVK